jgi:hypothetical protein
MTSVIMETLLSELNQLYQVLNKISDHAEALTMLAGAGMLDQPVAQKIYGSYVDSLRDLSIICHSLSITAEDITKKELIQ